MSHQLPDVRATSPDVTVGLSQVGVTGVDKLVKIAREGKDPIVLTAGVRSLRRPPRLAKGGGHEPQHGGHRRDLRGRHPRGGIRRRRGLRRGRRTTARATRLHLENGGIDGSRVHAPRADAGQRPRDPAHGRYRGLGDGDRGRNPRGNRRERHRHDGLPLLAGDVHRPREADPRGSRRRGRDDHAVRRGPTAGTLTAGPRHADRRGKRRSPRSI